MSALVGRQAERERLQAAIDRGSRGHGSLVLVAGEAGVGKTSLVESVAGGAEGLVMRGACTHGATAPYGPLVAAMRSHLRGAPGALSGCGPLVQHLAVILPEL